MKKPKVRHLLKVAFFSGFLFCCTHSYIPVHSQEASIEQISFRLQQALNSTKDPSFKLLLPDLDASHLESQYLIFLNRFPDAKWEVRTENPQSKDRKVLEILVTGQRTLGDHQYSLESKQRIEVKISGGKIIEHELLGDYAILRSNKKPLPISVQIPDTVLTGSKYDVDVIFDEPLGDSVITGALIGIDLNKANDYINPDIELSPINGGGLFKSVQAPYQAGRQRWAALLAHPDGVITVTKLVTIVSNEEELSP